MATRGNRDIDAAPCEEAADVVLETVPAAAAAALQIGVSRVFLCNDATFVHGDRLLAVADASADYQGYEVAPGIASLGAGCLLSQAALECLASAPASYGDHSEDVIAGRWLCAHGFAIRHDPTFFPWPTRVPTPWNDQVTAHGIPPNEMPELQRSLEEPCSTFICVLDGEAEYGAIGVNGYRGFTANDHCRIELPAPYCHPTDVFVSAHASSWINVEISRPARLSGLLDLESSSSSSSVEFLTDGRAIGHVSGRGESTAAVPIDAGFHQLEAIAAGPNSGCYSVWRFSIDRSRA